MPPGGCCRFTWFFFGLVCFLHVSTSADRADALVSVAHKHKEGGILQRERFVCCYTPDARGSAQEGLERSFRGQGERIFLLVLTYSVAGDLHLCRLDAAHL